MEMNDKTKEKLINAISGKLSQSIGETQISEILKGSKVKIPMNNSSNKVDASEIKNSEIKKLEKEIESIIQELHAMMNDKAKEKLINAISGKLSGSIGETQISEILKGSKVKIPMNNSSNKVDASEIKNSEIKKLEKEIESINQELHAIKSLLDSFNNTSEKIVNHYVNEKESTTSIYKKLTALEKEISDIKHYILWLP